MKNIFLILSFLALNSGVNASGNSFFQSMGQNQYFKALSLANIGQFFRNLWNSPRLKVVASLGIFGIGGLYLYKKAKLAQDIEFHLSGIESGTRKLDDFEESIQWLNGLPESSFSSNQKTRLEALRKRSPQLFYYPNVSNEYPDLDFDDFIDPRQLIKTDDAEYKRYLAERQTFCQHERPKIEESLDFLEKVEKPTLSNNSAILKAAIALNTYATDCFTRDFYTRLNKMKNKFPDHFYLPDNKRILPSSKMSELESNLIKNETYETARSAARSKGEQSGDHPRLPTFISQVWSKSLLRKQ